MLQGDLEKSCKAAELHSLSAALNVICGTLPSVQRSIHPTYPFMYADPFSQPQHSPRPFFLTRAFTPNLEHIYARTRTHSPPSCDVPCAL
jgi:hypothetical protein